MKLFRLIGWSASLALAAPVLAQLDHPTPGQPAIPPMKIEPRPAMPPQPGAIMPVKADHPPVFDERADARKAVAVAMKAAGKENRRVLILWGNNASEWSRQLFTTFQKEPKLSKELQYEYDLVLVDAGTNGKNLDLAGVYRADVIRGGFPFLTILDPAGTVVANQETGVFEAKPTAGEAPGHKVDKLLEFLKQHRAKPLAADAVLKEARDSAKSSDRKVFLHFGAPWCGWCKRLDAWLARPEVSGRFGKDFVEVKVDQDRMTNGKEVFALYNKNSARSGIPWFVILDPATGEAISTSDGPSGNIGFPASEEEIAHFVTMIKSVAKKMSDSDIEALKQTLMDERKK